MDEYIKSLEKVLDEYKEKIRKIENELRLLKVNRIDHSNSSISRTSEELKSYYIQKDVITCTCSECNFLTDNKN